jgi:transposase InsO family protein
MRCDRPCEANGIAHRRTTPKHPWTNGQVERMNRTITDAITKRDHDKDHERLTRHPELVLNAHNHTWHLKTLKDLTPAQRIWKKEQTKREHLADPFLPLRAEPCD